MHKRAVKKQIIVIVIAVALLIVGTALFSQNVSQARHPNLWAAQSFIVQAIDKLTAAQKANDFDMNGHAAKAKQLLQQAFDEIKLAAEAANK